MESVPDSSLIDVSAPYVMLSASPLLLIALLSYSMDLKLESPIIVGCIRSFLQLSVLGLVLKPIFRVGEDHWWVVVAYILLMLLVTAFESAGRARYYFKGMLGCVFLSLLVNVTAIGLFAFGLIIKPQPVVWEPQYVIPIMGMILGNCINGISLSLNNLVTSLVENQSEIDLLLAFGANSAEASSRVVREAVRTGTMPMLNGMAVIGIVSIPGMMTGQILGGSPVMEAARYQMLIMYWIAISSFGCILAITFLVLRAAFDSSTDMLHRERLFKRKERRSFLDTILQCGRSICRLCTGKAQNQMNDEIQPLTDDIETTSYVIPKGTIQIRTLLSCPGGEMNLDVSRLELSFPVANSTNRRVIFRDLSFSVGTGEIILVGGPSGVGKSQLLRVVAGLAPQDSGGGEIMLQGVNRKSNDMTLWRHRVRYITQGTVDAPGTPRDFVERITSFRSWKLDTRAVSEDEFLSTCRALLTSWGMQPTCMDKKWSLLSGGEAQRIIVAIALASRPLILLLDECTSALDLRTKILVEQSVEEFVTKDSVSVLWVTHDVEQIHRMSQPRKT